MHFNRNVYFVFCDISLFCLLNFWSVYISKVLFFKTLKSSVENGFIRGKQSPKIAKFPTTTPLGNYIEGSEGKTRRTLENTHWRWCGVMCGNGCGKGCGSGCAKGCNNVYGRGCGMGVAVCVAMGVAMGVANGSTYEYTSILVWRLKKCCSNLFPFFICDAFAIVVL